VSVFGRKPAGDSGSGHRSKNQRRAPRRSLGQDAWIRLDGGFATRPCKVTDLSDTGVQITIADAETLRNEFTLLLSRTAGSGRRARIRWRRGSKIGAEFV
jgi:hypothetical protein